MKTILLVLGFILASPAVAMTQDDIVSGMLLPGWQMENGNRMVAMSLDLSPGWKTYWRAPGDAGIPPRFDWSGSANIRNVHLHWPAPVVFQSNGMQTVGYHDRLTLPIEITPDDSDQPMSLRLSVDLGICKDICVPVTLNFTQDLSSPGASDPVIRAALNAQPTGGKEAGLQNITCPVDQIKDGLRLTAHMQLPKLAGDEVVVFETVDANVWVSGASVLRRGDTLIAASDLVPPQGAPFVLDRQGITITILADGKAVEIQGCPAP